IIKTEQVEDFNPWGEYYKICIEYYRDYGETLVATYCHDLHKNYGKSCETVHDLVSEKLDNNTVHLSWSEPESSLPVQEYRIYRNEEFLEATTNSTYLDENLPIGEYDYYVITHYEMDCVSDSSNHVQVEVEVGVEEYLKPNFSIIPNPATNQVTISSATPFHTVEMINFLGQTVVSQTAASNSATLNISHLNNGIYFVRVIFEDGSNIKKLVKQ
ncbi:MAG: T9SS type A sorting domain-containing protein, partial [Bacteroidetes bacterium]|nr:T9SS type A sorting domain-containing protein [Bacteroidota bacterium]